MNYVCTFIDQNYIDNLFNVWIPTLKKNFSGKIVVIGFNLTFEQVQYLKNQEIIILNYKTDLIGYKIVSQRLNLQKDFIIKTLKDDDKIMLIDEADVVFQSEIDSFFNTVTDKIFYSSTGTSANNRTMFDWLQKFLKNTKTDFDLIRRVTGNTIKASGMLVGTKKAFLTYFERHNEFIKQYNADYFLGINQIILTALISLYPNDFQETSIQNCRLTEKDIIIKNGICKKDNVIIPIAHFSCPQIKQLYNDIYLKDFTRFSTNTNINDKKCLKILWLFKYNPVWNYNHWFHMDFAFELAKRQEIIVKTYGLNMSTGYPQLDLRTWGANIKLQQLKDEFDFDVIIMDGKSRMEMYKEVLWLPRDFDTFNKTPKIMLEGDYHNHQYHQWYAERGVNIILHRHKINKEKAEKDLPNIKHIWFPCSVDTDIFKPNPDISRIEKIGFTGGTNPCYTYRVGASKILAKENLIHMCIKRRADKEYIKYLQSYVSHLNCSSTFNLDIAKMFEIMASGSVLLTDLCEENGVKELFNDNDYVTYKKDFSDLIIKAKQIINDKNYREIIIKNAMSTIEQRHTHKIRIEQLIDIITNNFNLPNYMVSQEQKLTVMERIKKFFTSTPVIQITSVPDKTMLEIPSKQTEKKEVFFPHILDESDDTEHTSEKIIRQLLKKNIKVCLLEDTAYNAIVNQKFGKVLKIAVNNQELAKQIVGEDFIFGEFPDNTKLYLFKDISIFVPFMISPYLQNLYPSLNISDILNKKKEELRLIRNTYQYCERLRRRQT
jgi:uncharacterized protein YkvS